ncbi:hypothetical protein MMC11_003990 [Xylographa trunciseda]|nr:hypothetical protein [Xylographa trunciseda]
MSCVRRMFGLGALFGSLVMQSQLQGRFFMLTSVVSLRMWCAPDEVQTKSATKTDPSASARSTIRRQPTMRQSPRSSRHRSHGIPPGLDRRYLLDIIRRDRDNAISMSSDRDELDEALADLERHEASNRRRLDSGRALLRDALSYEQPGQRMRQIRESALRYEVPPPVPTISNTQDESNREPASRPGNESAPTIEARWSPPPQYMPTPPYASTDRADQSPAESIPLYAHLPPLVNAPGATPSLTPRFAPAYRQEDSAFTQRVDDSRRARRAHLTSLREAYAGGHPPLRRNRHRIPYNAIDDRGLPIVIDHTDGLGDRRRSFSPEDNTWETLLTTITPDERLPSAESSFTSASVSASSLSSNSASSSTTLLTAPSSSSGTLNAISNICDDPTDSSCSETDDDFTTVMHHEFLDELPPPDPARYSANIHATGRRMSREINEQFARLRRRTDEELVHQRLQTMMERVGSQEPVPVSDDWWASAGLSRAISGRVERAERERL